MVKKYKKYLRYAKNHILNTNMLLSKNPDMILPGLWPTYFNKAEGTYVFDLENKKYLDMTCLVGQSTLGYSNKKLESYIKKIISKGNISSLNCPEEVELTKKILKIHRWADVAKYTRSGGEANALAIRIARCSSKTDNIAICGYHGWHDWYLAANLKNKKSLNSHLFENLHSTGVPKKLINTVYQFNYGNITQLQMLHKKYKIGIIKMEVCRNTFPNINFLKAVRKFSKDNNIILIFDECTTGFRYNLGGVHLKTGINPDIAIFGKAMGNGYAINAVIGSKKIMLAAKNSFISSTFWTERIGFAAALKTIEIMEKTNHWKKLNKNGEYLRSSLKKIFEKNNLDYYINSFPPIITFGLKQENNLFRSFLSKEMLKKNILATNVCYVNIFHTHKLADIFLKNFDFVLRKYKTLKKKKYKWLGKNFYINRTKD